MRRVALLFAACAAAWTSAWGATPEIRHGATVEDEVHHDTSPPLWLIRPPVVPAVERDYPVQPLPRPGRGLPPSVQPGGEAAEATPDSTPEPFIPSLLLNLLGDGTGFTGPAGSFTVTKTPPDTVGDVGPSNYVQVVNNGFSIFNKAGTALYGPVVTNSLWSGFGGSCEVTNNGDGTVLYDPIADRWLISQFSVSTGSYLQCVAVSVTSDPTGSWYRYAFSYPNFPDYPKPGVWPDAYYMTFNMFTGSPGSFLGSKLCAYDRGRMLSGFPATQQCFDTSNVLGGVLPADLDGATLPPAGSPEYLVGLGATTTSLAWWKFHVDWATPANTTLTGPLSLTVPSYTDACSPSGTCIPQSGGGLLDSLGDRLMFRLAYRRFADHESLVANHSITVGTTVGVRWYELRVAAGSNLTLFQSGTYSPDANARWMGSMAMDRAGNIGLGYSVSSTVIKPQIRYTGRLAGDAPGTMPQGEGTLVSGAGAQSSNISRWGDYSAMSVDPIDDCTFWYTDEYLQANGGNWSTRIGTYRFCTPPANDFWMAAIFPIVNVSPGGQVSTSLSTMVTNGSTQTVALSVSGLPSGASAGFSPASITTGANATLTVSAGSAAMGTSFLTVTGTGASVTHVATVQLNIVPVNDFVITANPADMNMPQGGELISTIATTVTNGVGQSLSLSVSGLPSGATYHFSPAAITAGGSSTLTVDAGSGAAGTYTLSVTGTGPYATHSTTIALTITCVNIYCDDGNPCTDDACDFNGQCQHANNTAPCSDGNACTRTDTCQAGACVASNPVVCPPADQCNNGNACDPATGLCSSLKPDGTVCDDGAPCTAGDSCRTGVCVSAETLHFATGSPFPAGVTPVSLASADFNRDGHPDLAVADSGTGAVAILLGSNAGQFAAPTMTFTGVAPAAVATADFNLDGNPDFAVADSALGSVSVYLGNGSGAFTAAGPAVTIGGTPIAMAVADFNADGLPDLAVVDQSDNLVLILKGSGGQVVAAGSWHVGSAPSALAVADFDLNGYPDLAVANSGSGDVSVLLTFANLNLITPGGSPFHSGSGPAAVGAADFNLDGKPDLAVANLNDANVRTFLGNGAGGFTEAFGSPVSTGSGPDALAVADFNLDGKPDLAVGNNGGGSVSLLLGGGTGRFGAPAGSPVSPVPSPVAVVVGDFSGDGKPDLAVANRSSNTVTSLLGAPAMALPDLDGDSHPDAACGGDDCDDTNPSLWHAPAGVTGLTVVQSPSTAISWDSQSATAGPATVYDLVSGPITSVGNPGFASASCLVSGAPPGYTDTRPNPTLGTGYWYVSRARSSCGIGTFGSPEEDDAISACP